MVTTYHVDSQMSIKQFEKHLTECNKDFKWNIVEKFETIKRQDTKELYKKVEELKTQEAQELSELNKTYMELDVRCKKLDRKVSSFQF